MTAIKLAILNIKMVARTRVALFFTLVFPLVWLFVYEGLFAHGNSKMIMYLFGPVVTLNIMGSAFWGLGLQSVMQRERGILRRFRLAPINSLSIVGANLLANYLLELPVIALLVFAAKFIFHMPLAFNWWTLFVLVSVGTFGFAGFGLTIASIANTMQEAQIYNNLIWLTLLFLSGATIPLPMLPGWIQRFATFLPATYIVTSFQAVMIQGESLLKHMPELVALALSGIFGMLFAWKLFRWEKEEKVPNTGKVWALVFIFPFLLIGFWMNLYANPTKAWASTYSMLSSGFGGNQRASASEAIEVLEDFEDPQSASKLDAHWRPAKVKTPAETAVKLALISPGADSTGHAMRLEAAACAPLRMGSRLPLATFELPAPSEGSQSDSLQFYVRGEDGIYWFEVFGPESNDYGPEIRLMPSGGWQRVEIPVPPALTKGNSKSSSKWSLQISADGTDGPCRLDLDQIAYSRGAEGSE